MKPQNAPIKVKKLLEWKPMLTIKKASKLTDGYYYTPKDEEYLNDENPNIPFFSESFLYNLLGKEDARTLLLLLRQALGVDYI